MSQSITIELEGKSYEIKPLTLGQLRELAVGIVLPDTADPQESVGRSFDRAVKTISAGLIVQHPEMTPEKIYSMQITRDEMRAANDAILKFSGLIQGDAPSGEAQAAPAA